MRVGENAGDLFEADAGAGGQIEAELATESAQRIDVILTVAPSLGELGAVFGLVQILWFGWISVLMLRSDNAQSVVPADATASRPRT